ncbi:MAG: methyltransferase dimerization domain-containing protein, partial [Pseudomonadota bacterium]
MLSRIRNRFFMAGGFQRWASSTPIVRGIARRRAARLFDLCAGFVYSQVLAALVDIDIFETLRSGPVAPGLVASRADLSEEAFMRLAKAGEALGLLQRFSRGRIGLGPQGAALLGNPSVFAMIKHHRLLYDDLADPLSVWRSPRGATKLGHFWGYGTGEAGEGCAPGDGKAYSALMATTQRFVS